MTTNLNEKEEKNVNKKPKHNLDLLRNDEPVHILTHGQALRIADMIARISCEMEEIIENSRIDPEPLHSPIDLESLF